MNKSGNIPYLDGWRGLAIGSVLLGHFFPGTRFGWVGEFGVQLFFALSGYLMSNVLFIKQVGFAEFFARRSIRIVPTFLLFVSCIFLYASVFQPVRFTPSIPELLATITFSRTYLPAGMSIWNDTWPIGHLWSLNVEEHSYIFLALIALSTRRYRSSGLTVAALCVATVASLIFSYSYFASPPTSGSPGHIRTEAACLGLLAAAALRYARHTVTFPRLIGLPWLPLAAIFLSVACTWLYRYRGFNITLTPLLLAFAVNFLDQSPTPMRAALSARPLRWLGICSFSLYLWQQPFFVLKKYHGQNELLMLGLAVAAGALSYYLFEQPVRQWLGNAWQTRKTRARKLEFVDPIPHENESERMG